MSNIDFIKTKRKEKKLKARKKWISTKKKKKRKIDEKWIDNKSVKCRTESKIEIKKMKEKCKKKKNLKIIFFKTWIIIVSIELTPAVTVFEIRLLTTVLW